MFGIGRRWGVVQDAVGSTAHATSSAIAQKGGAASAAATATSGPSSTSVSNAVSSATGHGARADTTANADAFYRSSAAADSEASVEGAHSAANIRSDAYATRHSVAASSSKGTIKGRRSSVDVQTTSEATKHSTALATGEAHVSGNNRNAVADVYALAEDSGFSEATAIATNNKDGLHRSHHHVVYAHEIEDNDDDLYHTSPSLTSTTHRADISHRLVSHLYHGHGYGQWGRRYGHSLGGFYVVGNRHYRHGVQHIRDPFGREIYLRKERPFAFYGYRNGAFFLDNKHNAVGSILHSLPRRPGYYYCDGDVFYPCHEDNYGIYFVTGHHRFYVIYRALPSVFRKLNDGYDYGGRVPFFCYYLRKGIFHKQYYH